MIERQIEIATAAGRIDTFVCHPERHGPHPVVIFFMDAPGIREELRDMVRRLATVGYYVLLPNLYYRSHAGEFEPFIGRTGPAADAAREKMFALMRSLSIAQIMEDTGSLIAFANADVAASKGRMGCVGYCMSGQYAISAAVRYADRIRVAASYHGSSLVTEEPDSPHLAAGRTDARLYFGCSEIDHWLPPEMLERLKDAVSKSNGRAEVEVYPGVDHGFAFPQRSVFDKPAAERHWERLFSLLKAEIANAR
jgi:carboxymethylenebutenolidase